MAYYFTFKKFILWRDLKTPGREVATEPEYTDAEIRTSGNAGGYDIPGILKALGGKSNIVTLDNCITRLRLIVKDGSIINDEELQKLGALGVVHLDDTSVQVIIGTKVTTVRNGLDALLEGAEPEAKKFQIGAPLAGKAVPLTEVPDAVFSTGMIGQGAAIQPTDGQVVSPVDGVVTTVFPTKHAIGIKATNGMEILIHLGIDTVKLDGKPFETKVAVDEQVKVGDLLATADWQMVADAGLATVTPVVVTNFAEYTNVGMITKGMVEKNTPIIEVESA